MAYQSSMSSVPVTLTVGPPPAADPARLLAEAAGAAKCAACGCAHEASATLAALPAAAPRRLRDAAQRLATSLTAQRYPCLGCAVCWPAEALSLVQEAGLVPEGAAWPAEPVVPRLGWPPLPGDYTVLRYTAPVAVCTLGGSDLAAAVAAQAGPEVAIAGTLTTENLGIDRLVRNTIANPHLRFVVVCGHEVEQRIGHHPGGSLLALAANGTDERARIIAAPRRRPRLRNLTPGRDSPLPRPCRGRRPDRHPGRRRGPGRRPAVRCPRPRPRGPNRRAGWPCPYSRRLVPHARSPTRPATWSCKPTRGGGCL